MGAIVQGGREEAAGHMRIRVASESTPRSSGYSQVGEEPSRRWGQQVPRARRQKSEPGMRRKPMCSLNAFNFQFKW